MGEFQKSLGGEINLITDKRELKKAKAIKKSSKNQEVPNQKNLFDNSIQSTIKKNGKK
jgi:hypothetical protein